MSCMSKGPFHGRKHVIYSRFEIKEVPLDVESSHQNKCDFKEKSEFQWDEIR